MVLKVVSCGDSVAWGQGLSDEQKYHRIAAEEIARRRGIDPDSVEILHLAHSGATLTEDDDSGDVFGPLDAPPFWQEVPRSRPSISRQIRAAAQLMPDADLVLLDGGINDLGFMSILNPFSDDHTLDDDIEHIFETEMRALLGEIQDSFPRAKIVVTGYFPIVSGATSSVHLVALLAVASLVLGVATPLVLNRAIFRALRFHKGQLDAQRGVVAALADHPSTRGAGIVFANPGFGRNNAVAAPNELLWSPALPAGSIEDVLERIVEDPSLISPEDSVLAERAIACEALDPVSLSNPGGLQCPIAAIGHPNVAGARRYADAIVRALTDEESTSLRAALGEVGVGGQQLSLRAGIERHFDNSLTSLRGWLQHRRVDCLAVRVRTRPDSFSGTDATVFLRTGPGHRWPLAQGVITGDFQNDFEAGDVDTYILDTADQPSGAPLRLGEITELTLELEANPIELIASDWDPGWIELSINGRDLGPRHVIDNTVTFSQPWTASNFPRT